MILDSVKVRNFKAVRNSGTVKLGPLTVFIGNNGSGKSSLVEALETYQTVVARGLDEAMQRFMGIEHVQNKYAKPDTPIVFEMRVRGPRGKVKLCMAVASDANRGAYAIKEEMVEGNDFSSELPLSLFGEAIGRKWKSGLSMLASDSVYWEIGEIVASWQFLSLNPEGMGYPLPQKRARGQLRLARDGSNIAEFLLDLHERDSNAMAGIIDTMSYVLPYARGLQAGITSELERKAWLHITESDFKVPGWMLSTGTLRILALLALLRHPTPPPLIVVEELENGLDPRSVHLIVEEIRKAVQSGVTQVIATTHSPYLLDLLTLEHLVVVERDADGHPCFTRPGNQQGLQAWAEKFAPGKLYTMGNLTGLGK